jgi:hypothetical protein
MMDAARLAHLSEYSVQTDGTGSLGSRTYASDRSLASTGGTNGPQGGCLADRLHALPATVASSAHHASDREFYIGTADRGANRRGEQIPTFGLDVTRFGNARRDVHQLEFG